MGPSREEKQAYGGLNSLTGFASSHGQGDISTAEDFWRSILEGGDKAAKVLAPEISGIKERGQQKKQTAAQFGTRSGGTNASLQQTDDETTAAINRMVDELTGTAAGQLGSLGTSLTGMGFGGYENLFKEANVMQQQDAAKWGDIFKSISDIAGTAGGFFKAGSLGDKIFSGISSATSGG